MLLTFTSKKNSDLYIKYNIYISLNTIKLKHYTYIIKMSIPPTTQKTNQSISDALISFFWGTWGRTDSMLLGSFCWSLVIFVILCFVILSCWPVSSCSGGMDSLHAHLSPHSRLCYKDPSHIRLQWTLAKCNIILTWLLAPALAMFQHGVISWSAEL